MRKSKTQTKKNISIKLRQNIINLQNVFFRNIVHSNDGSCTYEVYISFLPTMSMLFKVVRFV